MPCRRQNACASGPEPYIFCLPRLIQVSYQCFCTSSPKCWSTYLETCRHTEYSLLHSWQERNFLDTLKHRSPLIKHYLTENLLLMACVSLEEPQSRRLKILVGLVSVLYIKNYFPLAIVSANVSLPSTFTLNSFSHIIFSSENSQMKMWGLLTWSCIHLFLLFFVYF